MPKGDGFAGRHKHEAEDKKRIMKTFEKHYQDSLEESELRAQGKSVPYGTRPKLSDMYLTTGTGKRAGRVLWPRHNSNYYRKDIPLGKK